MRFRWDNVRQGVWVVGQDLTWLSAKIKNYEQKLIQEEKQPDDCKFSIGNKAVPLN